MKKFLAFIDLSTGTLYELGFLVFALFFIVLINPFYYKDSNNTSISDLKKLNTHYHIKSIPVDCDNWQND
jgi:hypothetical protein